MPSEEPKITLSPHEGARMLVRALVEKRLLGPARDSDTPEMKETRDRISRTIKTAAISVLLQAGVVAMGALVIGLAIQSLRPSFQKPTSPPAAHGIPEPSREQVGDPTREDVAYQLRKVRALQAIADGRIASMELAERYIKIHPNNERLVMQWLDWRINLDSIVTTFATHIDGATSKPYDMASAEEVFRFFLRHGRPSVFLKDGVSRYVELRPDGDFAIASLDPSPTENANHRWFREHYFPYFDSIETTLFLPSSTPRQSTENRIGESTLDFGDVWFALTDAMTRMRDGAVDFSRPNPPAPVRAARLLHLPEVRIVVHRLKTIKPSSLGQLVSILRESAETFAEEAYGQFQIEKPKGALLKKAKEITMYRLVRFLLLENDSAFTPELKGHLSHLAKNPSLLTIIP